MNAPIARHVSWMLVLGAATACGNDTKKSTTQSPANVEAGATCSGASGPVGESHLSVLEEGAPDGGMRGAIVHVPQSYDPSKPTMLVLNLHGLLEPAGLQESTSHMSDAADQRGFIVAYPEGLAVGVGLSWNAGACCANSSDDVGFIRDLVKKLESEYCIDPKRVFATGLSNGAMMSYGLGCDASDIFAAVAPVAGALEESPCNPQRPVPLLEIHGTGDTIVPFNGGTDGLYHVLTFPPVSYSMDAWRHLDGCPDSPAPNDASIAAMPDDSTPDGGPNPSMFAGSTLVFHQGDAACHSWTGCKEGSEVELCSVVNGGHSWPGGPPFVGKSSRDIDATKTIIDFFEKHPMP